MNSTSEWTFITNHGLILSYMFQKPTSRVREIADHVGLTERTTHKIISDLAKEGYLIRTKKGNRNTYQIESDLPLRHHTKEDIMVSELIEALTAK